ncbi:MAG: VWA domain-containing protein [Candidatus Aminicenantes bacterium]|nr:VWA domain-containing protein [Candidatus Aminicenantes bacterium]
MKSLLIVIALIFFVTALAGPRWGEKFENLSIKGIEMIFLLDTSFSMNAEDIKPDRFAVAKNLINTIVDNLETDYVGLIKFAGTAHVQCPLTIDYEAMKLLTEAAEISPPEEQGTDFYEALSLALKAGRVSSNSNKIIFLITDGEDQEERWEDILKEIKSEKLIIFPIGIGIPSGAPIPLRDESGNMKGWKKDNEGNMVRTKLNEVVLRRIASETGGQYFRLTDSAGMEILLNNLKTFERSVLRKKVRSVKIERFHYPLSIGIILLIIELLLIEKKIKWKRS